MYITWALKEKFFVKLKTEWTDPVSVCTKAN